MKNVCIYKCGDGFKVSEEKWDDGNTISGDGCSSDCITIESNYLCSGGSPTSKDIWNKWDKGFYQNSSTNPTSWVTKCGDGTRAGAEVWDDGNAISGDGWSGDWLSIEAGWVCVGSYFGITDICLQWDPGYGSNPDYTQCIGSEVPRNVQSLAVASSVAAYSGLSTNLVVTGFSSSTSTSSNSFGMINQIQLVILLPLIGAFLPLKIYDYLKSMKTSLFNLSFLPTNNSENMIHFKNWFDFKQPNSFLNLLDLNSGSWLVNILALTTTIGIVIGLHIVIVVIYFVLKKTNKCMKVTKLILKILKFLTFNFYIGVFLETYILFLLTDFSEIYYQNKNGVQNGKSMVMSYVILAFMLCMILLALWQWCKSRNSDAFEKQTFFRNLVDGMKPKWICRSYWFVFLVRRSLFGIIIFFIMSWNLMIKVSLIVAVQALLLIYILILRPQESIKDNFSDVVNEVFYLYYCVFLFYYNSEDRWDDTTTEAYFWILMSNNFVLILIALSKYSK